MNEHNTSYPEYYYPMLVRDNASEDIFSEASCLRWKKKRALPEKRGEVLIHNKTIEWIAQTSQKFNLNEEQTSNLSRIVRDFGLNDISESQIPLEVEKKFSSLSPEGKKFLTDFVIHLFQINLPPREPYVDENESSEIALSETSNVPSSSSETNHAIEMPILNALVSYPRISQQLITSQNLEMRGTKDLVRPSVKNWITIYQQEMGPPPHESFERGNFLFQNANVIKLSQKEKSLLLELLKSLDENKPLPISLITQEILLDAIVPSDTLKQLEKSGTNNASLNIPLPIKTVYPSLPAQSKDSSLHPERESEAIPQNTPKTTTINTNPSKPFFGGLRIKGITGSYFDDPKKEIPQNPQNEEGPENPHAKNLNFTSGQTFMGEDK